MKHSASALPDTDQRSRQVFSLAERHFRFNVRIHIRMSLIFLLQRYEKSVNRENFHECFTEFQESLALFRRSLLSILYNLVFDFLPQTVDDGLIGFIDNPEVQPAGGQFLYDSSVQRYD